MKPTKYIDKDRFLARFLNDPIIKSKYPVDIDRLRAGTKVWNETRGIPPEVKQIVEKPELNPIKDNSKNDAKKPELNPIAPNSKSDNKKS
jgi:hypothetical protein